MNLSQRKTTDIVEKKLALLKDSLFISSIKEEIEESRNLIRKAHKIIDVLESDDKDHSEAITKIKEEITTLKKSHILAFTNAEEQIRDQKKNGKKYSLLKKDNEKNTKHITPSADPYSLIAGYIMMDTSVFKMIVDKIITDNKDSLKLTTTPSTPSITYNEKTLYQRSLTL